MKFLIIISIFVGNFWPTGSGSETLVEILTKKSPVFFGFFIYSYGLKLFSVPLKYGKRKG
jgi:hypothetical protein